MTPITATEFFTFAIQLIIPFSIGYLAARGFRQWSFIAKYTIGFVITMLLAPVLLVVVLFLFPADSGIWAWLGGKTASLATILFDWFIGMMQSAGLVAMAALAGAIAGFQKRTKRGNN